MWRAIEEALAETVAQVGVNGFKQLLVGIKFPVDNGYVFLTHGGGYEAFMQCHGVLLEFAALIYTGVVAAVSFEMRFVATPAAADKPAPGQ